MAKFDVVKAWIDNVAYSHSKSENTEREYRYNLSRFCEFIGKTPEQILEEYEGMTDREFRRKYARYVRALISHLMNEDYSPSTVVNSVTTVKSFFKYNDLPLGHIPVGRRRVVFHNRDITKNEIERILGISRPRDQAFYSMMAQSGLRPDTLCSLRKKHIEPEFSKGIIPCKVDVPEEIAKGQYGSYFSFMGEESVKYLKDYFNKRPEIGPEDFLFTSHGKDKPLNPKSISMIFARTIQQLKEKGIIDLKDSQFGKPGELRLYNLRKFFRKEAGHAGVEYVNFWMGHKTDYKAPHIPASDIHYFPKEDMEFHRQLYIEHAMPHLRLETPTATETDKIIGRQAEEIERLNERIKEIEEKYATVEEIDKMLAERKTLLEGKDKDAQVYFRMFGEYFRTIAPKELEQFITSWKRMTELAVEHGWNKVHSREEAKRKVELARKKKTKSERKS